MAKEIKNRYLEKLGIKRNEHSTNFCNDENDPRQNRWAKQRRNYGFDDRETWNLDHIYIEWLYSHLMMYKKVTIVDMKKDMLYDVVVAKDKVIPQISMKDALDFMLKELETYLTDRNKDFWTEVRPELFEALHMFADTFQAWWW